MAEIPKPDLESLASLRQMNGFRGGSRIQTMAISDQIKHGLNGKSDTFIVDLESFSNGGLDKDVTANSKINMQRSFSRKGSLQGGDQELGSSSSSPTRAGQAGCNSTPEKVTAAYSQPPVVVAVGPTDPSNNQPSHQPTNKTSSFSATTMAPKSRWGRRYNSFKRSPPPYWFSDPKRVLLFFATLSILGTLLLIYFTLSMSKSYENDTNPEWQQ